ncbi:MAG: hypothetical protein SP4CHLAM5_02620 [Chlamydiia bacterium]|nr:hypothetical protein [Chlamydiia bacterium]MCH9618136.1 hypothetical protein [Chlamydiia bacterium]MCH9624016.1 hypothetical protein [Chlamydiia bacterium]
MSESTGSIGQNYFINSVTAPWSVVPEEREGLSILRIRNTVCSLGCSWLFGFIPAIVCGLAERMRSTKIVVFLGAPWELIDDDEEDALLKQAIVTIASAATSFGIGHFASKHLKPSLLAQSLSYISSNVNLMEWVRENLPPLRDYSRAITCLGMHVTASLILENRGFFRLSKKVGCLNDFIAVQITNNIYVSVDREFLTKHPQVVLKLLAENFRRYIKDGNDQRYDLDIRVKFKNEKSGYDHGPTREFFFLLFSGLLSGESGRYRDILYFTDQRLSKNRCFRETSDFYRSFGLLLGAIAKTKVKCGVGNLIPAFYVIALLVPNEIQLYHRSSNNAAVSYSTESDEIKIVLQKIARILFREDMYALAALENFEDEDIEPLMAGPERVLEMSLGMFEFYKQSGQSSWSEIRENPSILIGEIIGNMNREELIKRIRLDLSPAMTPYQKRVVTEKALWLTNWLRDTATDEQLKGFLIFFSAAPVMVFSEYVIFPEPKVNGGFGAITCHGRIIISYNSTPGIDDTQAVFITNLEDTISPHDHSFTTA